VCARETKVACRPLLRRVQLRRRRRHDVCATKRIDLSDCGRTVHARALNLRWPAPNNTLCILKVNVLGTHHTRVVVVVVVLGVRRCDSSALLRRKKRRAPV